MISYKNSTNKQYKKATMRINRRTLVQLRRTQHVSEQHHVGWKLPAAGFLSQNTSVGTDEIH